MSRAGSICRELGTLYPHGSLIVMLSSFVIHIFSWAHTGPDISIYRTGADGVRSCLATKPISTSYRAFAFSFDRFFFAVSLLKSSYFFFERGLRHIFHVKGENTTPGPLQFSLGNMYMLHDRVGRFIQISDRGVWNCRLRDVDKWPARVTRENLFSWRKLI